VQVKPPTPVKEPVTSDVQKKLDIKNHKLCKFGRECKPACEVSCDRAHSIDELDICPKGIECDNKMCVYMIHSEKSRQRLKDYIKTNDMLPLICKNYHSWRICNGKCRKIHFRTGDAPVW
jgi:hypothetical protein